MVEHDGDDLRGSRFLRVDLSGSRFHGVMLRKVKITDAWVDEVDIDCALGRLIVNGVDVRSYVEQELDRREPERRLLSATDPDDVRAAWAMVQERAAATLARARALPSSLLNESVDGEHSYLQTLRHLVYATDRWITGPVQGEAEPWHPLGWPNHDPEGIGRALGLDVDAHPSLDEVLAARDDRRERVTSIVRGATAADLGRTVASPNGGTVTVAGCVRVVLREEWAHDGYARRDLEVLEGGGSR